VYVAPSMLAVSDDLPRVRTRRKWSPTASTLIHRARDAFWWMRSRRRTVAGVGRLGGDPGNPSDVAGELSIDARNTVVLRDLAVTGSAV
jgi:hypothetical protein